MPQQQSLYPALKTLLNTESLPQPFDSFVGTAVDKLFYKNYYAEVSEYGDVGYHQLALVFSSKLGFNILGGNEGLELLFNPGSLSGTTEIPVSFCYSLPVLRYIRKAKLQNLATVADFLKLILEILQFPEEELLFQVVSAFFTDYEHPLEEFVNQFNDNEEYIAYPRLTVPATNDLFDGIDDIFIQLNTNGVNVFSYILENYIGIDDLIQAFDNISFLFKDWLGNFSFNTFKDLFIPKFSASIQHLELALAFPRTWLKPLDANGNIIEGDVKSKLRYNVGGLNFSTENGFEFVQANSFNFDKSQIGNTGLTIGFTNAKLDFSKTTNIPEADAAGYPTDFTGVYAQHAILGFRNFGTPGAGSAEIKAENLFIGTGGVSGVFTLTNNGILNRDFGGFKAQLDVFQMEFKMGSIVSSQIKGKLTLNKLKQNGQAAVIDISAQIKDDGNFNITAVSKEIIPLNFLDVLTISVKTLQLGKEARGYYAEISGVLDFDYVVPLLGDILPKGVAINKLRIWDDGSLEFQPGFDKITISRTFNINIGPVKMEVKNISIGSHKALHNDVERHYLVFTFDGTINTGRAGVNTSGNGIKFYFTIDDGPFHSFLSVDRINIDMSIPGNVTKEKAAFLLNGYLSMVNPSESAQSSTANMEYGGAVTFSLPRLKMSGSAGMRLNPGVPAFIVDIGLELPTPIILGATGLGIYGFRGIIGQHYLPSKSATTPPLNENNTWWEYYKAKSTSTKREGIEIDKFASKSGFSVGAGASIATAFDSGKVFSSKLFLLLGLPDVFLMQGQAGILRSRIGLADTDDPPFSAFISIDSNAFMAGLGVNYNLPETKNSLNGAIFSLSGSMELAFFFNNASGWYLNLGKDQPENQRIRSRILTLFQGYAYLMISSRGFKAGAGAKFDFNRSFGPVSVAFGAWIDMGGSLSFKPVQIGAFIQVGGYAYIKVWKAKIGMTIAVGLAVDAPQPFIIQGSIYISFRVIFFKVKFTLELTWRFNNNTAPLFEPQPVISQPDPLKGYLPAAATNIQSGDVFTINYLTAAYSNVLPPNPADSIWKYNMLGNDIKEITIPLDSYIDIDLLKSVKPTIAKLGGGANQLAEAYSELIPPQKGLTPQVRHEYEVTDLSIYCWDASSTSWKPYQIYEAVTAIVRENEDQQGQPIINLSELKLGYWQFSQPNKYNKIRLLSQNMFSYGNQSTDILSDLDGLNFKRKDLFCYETITKQQTINWKDVAESTDYPDLLDFYRGGYTFNLNGVSGEVVNDAGFGANSLKLTTKGGKLLIHPASPITFIKLFLGENENNIKVDFVKTVYVTENVIADDYSSTTVVTKAKDQYMTPVFIAPNDGDTVEYNNLENEISRIEITFISDPYLSFKGDLSLGGYYRLPNEYTNPSIFTQGHDQEKDKALIYLTIYNKAFVETEVIGKSYQDTSGAVANWLLSSSISTVGNFVAIPFGSPDLTPGYFREDSAAKQNLGQVYQFGSIEDELLVPYQDLLRVEEGDFSIETMVLFNPFSKGISTVFSKVEEDLLTGEKKGYALHLIQEDTVFSTTTYPINELPTCAFYFTCYSGLTKVCFKVTDQLTVDCETGYISAKQYKQVLISVDRTNNLLEIFFDSVKKLSVPVPIQFDIVPPVPKNTSLRQISYLTEEIHRRQQETELTEEKLIDEIKLMGDGLSKTIQPVWRPNTIYALVLTTADIVNKNQNYSREVFGFRTAGPIGHFHNESKVYEALAQQDRADEFKLSNLKNYIDYERSFPDAQSRYELSKPVFYHLPKIRLIFNKAYIYAMYENFDAYQGLPAVENHLELTVVDVFGTADTPALVWQQLPDKEITIDNYRSLPPDQQVIFLMNLAATMGTCNAQPLEMKKRVKQGSYELNDLTPNKVYTAIFNAKYKPGNDWLSAEVHRFNFISSRYASFQEQASSFILDQTPGNERYAIYQLYTSFTSEEITNNIIPLLDSNASAADDVMRYASQYDRMVYGGLKLKNLESIEHTVLHLLVNIDPITAEQRVLGLLIRNPEPFNDPKLPVEPIPATPAPIDLRADTIILTMPQHEAAVFKYIHAKNTSAVLITNATMNFPLGAASLKFKYRIYNGENYTSTYEEYTSPVFNLEIN
ncbi:hypothetical protein [Nubsella zeaxanthinifaciens]|uniref:hypothetical protein n=1 Tax=Nubsella zeaxanthinifaciens TaxID=392412 RepID=UPI000DE43184|nr:hypothetical protein [Nubsella zeaxanthinifaciens]